MLIEFRVKNFRSLRDEQALSLAAAKDKTLQERNTLPSGLKAAPRLLRSAVIYGPNASGKSNLVEALRYMRAVVLRSATDMQPGGAFSVQPFRLNAETQALPSGFELSFVLDGVRYQYGFELTALRITYEYLLVYKASKPQQWFERRYDTERGEDVYHLGPALKGAKSVWEKATRANVLFLSMAVHLNSEQLRPVYDWFSDHLILFDDEAPLGPQYSLAMLRDESNRRAIGKFLATADTGIADIELQRREEEETEALMFHHVGKECSAVFDWHDESRGTRKLFDLAGPIMAILNKGATLVVDELDGSLHPLLVRRLIALFHDPLGNSAGAQLIFTTHNTSLLNMDVFRRDQIWFIKKGRDQASELYPLSDFCPRKHEALEHGYLLGRYGALPFFDDWQDSDGA